MEPLEAYFMGHLDEKAVEAKACADSREYHMNSPRKNVCFSIICAIAMLCACAVDVADSSEVRLSVWKRPDMQLVAYWALHDGATWRALSPDGVWYAVAGEPDYVFEVSDAEEEPIEWVEEWE